VPSDNNKSYANPLDATNASLPQYFPDMIQYITRKSGTLHDRLLQAVKRIAELELMFVGPWTSGPPNAIAFPPLPLISNNSASILRDAGNQDPTMYLPADTPPTVLAGFVRQKSSLIQRLGRNNVAAYEIINNNAGSLAVSVMHPLSRGTTHIASVNPFDSPSIDPRWLSNPTDRQVLLEALLFNRMLLATPPMQLLQPAQFTPNATANSTKDREILEWTIDNGIRTEFHPSGTCAMLPLDLGGVVDSRLRVYGTQNLRIVDASVFPMIPGAHLQAVVYGVAEKVSNNDQYVPSIY
jgi:choline dehydrogenase-like flavoprotein